VFGREREAVVGAVADEISEVVGPVDDQGVDIRVGHSFLYQLEVLSRDGLEHSKQLLSLVVPVARVAVLDPCAGHRLSAGISERSEPSADACDAV